MTESGDSFFSRAELIQPTFLGTLLRHVLPHPSIHEVGRTMGVGNPLHQPHGEQQHPHGERPRRRPERRRRAGLRRDGGRVPERREGGVGLERVRVGRARAGLDGGHGVVRRGGREQRHYVRRQRRRRVGGVARDRVLGRRGDGRGPERGGGARRVVERRQDGEAEEEASAGSRHRFLFLEAAPGLGARGPRPGEVCAAPHGLAGRLFAKVAWVW
jgi:hypothetical protein